MNETPLTDALKAALRSQAQPRMLALALVPIAVSALAWMLLYLFAGTALMETLGRSVGNLATPWVGETTRATIETTVAGLGFFAALFLFLPLVSFTTMLVTSLVAMPLALPYIAARDYPELERRRYGGVSGSVLNALAASLLYLVLLALSLPFWLIPPLALLLPIALTAGLNARLFRYDALAEHADAAEFRALRRECRGEWFLLGLIAAALQLVPLVNLVSPVTTGLAFVHFGLGELRRRRAVVEKNPLSVIKS